ncbi:SAM-dependent methyltransferase [Streptomyces flaveolus]|uniref:SAM-dependent methyltransferase n=1 Tax=Streptomyces flaveolus TaxID=67297 RepID=UPI0033F88D7D
MTGERSSINSTEPSIARVYDYLLGGKDNYAVDRAVGDVFKRDLPGSVAIAFANRAALTRAVREIVTTTGVRQFIDLGSGLPTADNVHQVAQRYAPESQVVYVDTDPQVLVHGRALLEENGRTRVVPVDVRDPEGVRTHPDTQALIDFDGRWRTDEEIESLLDGLEILAPGVVPASLWRPDEDGGPWSGDGERELTVWERLIAAGLARKP